MGAGDNGIRIDNWKEDFLFTTVFDFDNKNSLPFEYSITPSYLKSKVNYILNDKLIDRPLNNILPVSDYKIKLEINEDNYYCQIEKEGMI